MTIGGQDKKKVAILGVLFAVLGYYFYDGVIASPSVPSSTARPPAAAADPEASQTRPLESPGPKTQTRRAQVVSASRASRDEFVPVFREKRQSQDAAKPSFDNVDPTVHWELLSKLREIPAAGGTRNLFEVGPPPPKPADLAKAEPIVKP